MRGLKLTLAALVAGAACAACGGDVTEPTDNIDPTPPAFLGILGRGQIQDRFTGEVAASGNAAYTTTWGFRVLGGNAVYVWNVSGMPVLADSLIVDDSIGAINTLGDVQITPDGQYLVVATEPTGSIVVYDRTDPLHPTFVSQFMSPNTQAGVHTAKLAEVDGTLYGFLQIDPRAGQPARLVIVDMSDMENITEVYSRVMGAPYVHDVFVRDGLLFAALWNDGMTIFDIGGGGQGGSPSNPVILGNVQTETGQIHNIWWYHDPVSGSKKYVFMGEEGPGSVQSNTSSGDIYAVDISNVGFPEVVATFRVPGAGTHNFWVDEPSGILYAAYYNGGVRAIDIRGDLGTCAAGDRTTSGYCSLNAMDREVGRGATNGFFVWGVTGIGDRLFASDMASGLLVMDISPLKR
jgi:hypothetical protein